MALPAQQRLFHKYYVAYVPSVLAASSPGIPVAGRGRVVDIRYVPIVAVATANQTITPKVNATQITSLILFGIIVEQLQHYVV